MTLSAALLFALFSFRITLAVPVPDTASPSSCTDVTYVVETAERVPGQMFLSGESCKNDFSANANGRCKIGPASYDKWAVVPLVSKNLVGSGDTYDLSKIADQANTKLGYVGAFGGTSNGGTSEAYCDKALECGLTVTPQYIHMTGNRNFGPTCNAPQPAEPFEMWLPSQTTGAVGTIAAVETARCYKGDPPSGQSDIPACPAMDPWTEQVVPNVLPAGTFAKLQGTSPHGSGARFTVRFNSDNIKFGTRGQALLTALNEKVYKGSPPAATADAHNWQEYTDDLSAIAEFDFDAPDGTSLFHTCNAVAIALESVSGMGNSGRGVCGAR
ncbi:MAG: hypothetical protein Q9170_003476 [Blastenia crenularia]